MSLFYILYYNFRQIIDHQESHEVIADDETVKEHSVNCNNSKTNSLSKESSLNISKNCSKENVKQNQHLFADVFEIPGIKEKEGVKEFGALTRKFLTLSKFI